MSINSPSIGPAPLKSQVDTAFELIGKALPGYRPRPQQLQYAHAVADAFRDNARLVIEGPCGVGKSFGALLPAILSGRKVLYVTASLALQDQIVDKDLPFLQKHIRPFKFALVKGRSNYLCINEAAKMEVELAVVGTPAERALGVWSRLTLVGDRKEAPTNDHAAWRKFSVSSDECLGDQCEHRHKCFALKVLAEAQQADIVVANYHLLFAHLKVAQATGGNVQVLPRYDAIILDECHEAAAVARSFFGFKLTAHAIRRLAQRALREGIEVQGVIDASADFFSELRKYRQSEKGPRRLKLPDPVKWALLNSELKKLAAELGSKSGVEIASNEDQVLKKLGRIVKQHVAEIEAAMTLGPLAGSPAVYYVEDVDAQATLNGRPLDVSSQVARAYPHAGPAILTSATVTIAGDFKLLVSELGTTIGFTRPTGPSGIEELPLPVRTLAVPSPFDWAKQAAVVIPEAAVSVDAAILEVVRQAKGRTLVLCTSNKRVREVREALGGCGYMVLTQGDMPLAQLVDVFRSDVSSVLVGTSSLWKGIDVVGEALSCVVIDKLPFDVWTDPLVEARREHNGDEGWKMYLADAVVRFRQGVGRLIRSESDLGIVVILDSRVIGKGYGKTFLRSLPAGMGISTDLEAVGDFLGGDTHAAE